MMAPLEIVLDRLSVYGLRQHGGDRWRACCPAHRGSNRSALSIGIGREGQVLLRCWQGCDAEAVAGALGLELTDLFPPRDSSACRPQRRHLLTAGQALALLADESNLIAVAASSVARGVVLTDDDRARVLQAAGRIAYLRQEATA
jgi:hypothetical protein